MSWYVGQDGQQLWIQRDEMVYTVIQPPEKLELENLSYLVCTTKKSVFQEHLVNEDMDAKNNSRRRRDKNAGRQRGFVVRIEQEEHLRVVPWFKAAASKLLDCGVVSRVDADDAVNMKKKKKGDKVLILGANECRVETTCRIHHFAHGPGFRVEVAEGSMMQRIHFFTCKKELASKDWHSLLVGAVESTGAHVMLARRTKQTAEVADGGDGDAPLEQIRMLSTDAAQKEDVAWFESLVGNCTENAGSDSEASHTSEEGEQSPAAPAEDPPQAAVIAPAITPEGASGPAAAASSASAPVRSTPEFRPQARSAATEVPEWRRREPEKPEAPTMSLREKQQQQQQQQQKQQSSRQAAKQQQQSSRQQQPRQQQQQPPRQQQPPPRQPPRQAQQPQQQSQQPRQQPQQGGWWQVREQQQARQQPAPHQQQAKQGGWWQEKWWEEERWQEPAPSQPPSRPQQQAAESTGMGAPVRELFAKVREEERRSAIMEREVRDQGTKCNECGRGRPLKLFVDPDDDEWYCRTCWVDFYQKEPPNK